jgi:cell division protein ZapB
MISEFDQLSEKIDQLAELARSLRRENADLRLAMTALGDENADLASRIQQAHQRVSALLEKIPAAVSDESEETA